MPERETFRGDFRLEASTGNGVRDRGSATSMSDGAPGIPPGNSPAGRFATLPVGVATSGNPLGAQRAGPADGCGSAGAGFAERFEQVVGAAHGDAARRFDSEHREDTVLDHRREAPAAPAHAARRAVDLEPEGARQFAVAVGEQIDLPVAPAASPQAAIT